MIPKLILLISLLGSVEEEKILVGHLLEGRTEKCWTLDRLSRKDVVSCAATGVGFVAYAKASQNSIITSKEASNWIRIGFDEMMKANPHNGGWLYHFIFTNGKIVPESEISSIDSTIFYIGAEKAARILKDDKLLQHILEYKNKINIGLMVDSNGYFAHSFENENGVYKLSKWRWKHYSEGVLIYKYFNKQFTPTYTDFTLPLFAFFYPLAFYPEEKQWIDNLGRAIEYQKRITGRYGYSACDSPTGYSVNSPYVVSPLAVKSTAKFFPLHARTQLNMFGVDDLTPSMTINREWLSNDKILLDEGIALILISEKL